MVPQSVLEEVTTLWTQAGMKHRVRSSDVQQDVQKIKSRDASTRRMGRRELPVDTTLKHDFYRSYQEFTRGLGRLSRKFPHLVKFDPTASDPEREPTLEG